MTLAALDLTGKVAVVVGGTSGIGRALSLGLAEAGADVVASSRRADLCAGLALEIEALGRRSLTVTCDVTEEASLVALREQVLAELGRVDALVNCAGRTMKQPTLEMSDAEWQTIFDVNLMGAVRASRVFADELAERRNGRIINIASLSSFVAFFEVAAYCASKAAVASLTRSLALELGPRGVNVNAIAPGVFPTELNQALLDGTPRGQECLLRTPLRRFGRADELQGAVVFLASDAASFVNGEILAVDGGYLASGVNQ